MIFYPSGRILNNVTTTTPIPNDWSFGIVPWENQEASANDIVRRISAGLLNPNAPATTQQVTLAAANTDECKLAAKAFSCSVQFPYCPYTNAGISHIPVCRSMCLEVRNQCELGNALDCEASDWRDDDCFQMPNSGAFLLDASKGPYEDLPEWCVKIILFVVLLLLLLLLLLFSLAMNTCVVFHYPDSPHVVSFFLSCLMINTI